MKKEIVTKEDLLKVIDLFEEIQITYWLDGGWGVDALVGKQTRHHRDIDINYDANETERLLDTLIKVGYQVETDWMPVRAELYHPELGYLDIHPFIIEEDGSCKQSDLEGGFYNIDAKYFGQTIFEGRKIPCISIEGQKVFHSGYELRESDIHDLKCLEELSSN
ncbi:nucleotidyltransferase domain-containing protein [Anaerorhabdus furcosa]|uniref:2''-aminoglycoside nucleotidyltransferase n=1 Tax=Anaerorhabdus furcosa TaxID=118967 RepID=A0A1T4Q3B5_9FIRM|nr:aminoglycoside adenylyltransferase [Anaerorhabdus furcosa]SJZ98263.1 2''-aminoglycoside nucleotidyltransferase [Anaerorhabdus furcosa]